MADSCAADADTTQAIGPPTPSAGREMWSNPIIRSFILDHFPFTGDHSDKDTRQTLLSLARVDRLTFESCVKRIYHAAWKFPSYSLQAGCVVGEDEHSLAHYMDEIGATQERFRLYSTLVKEIDLGAQDDLQSIDTVVYALLYPELDIIRLTLPYATHTSSPALIKVTLHRQSDLGTFRNARLHIAPSFLLRRKRDLLIKRLGSSVEKATRAWNLIELETATQGPLEPDSSYLTPQELKKLLEQQQFRMRQMKRFTWSTTSLAIPGIVPVLRDMPDITYLTLEISGPVRPIDLSSVIEPCRKLEELDLAAQSELPWNISLEESLAILSTAPSLTSVAIPLSLISSTTTDVRTTFKPLDIASRPRPTSKLAKVTLAMEHAGSGMSVTRIAGYLFPFFCQECGIVIRVTTWCKGVPSFRDIKEGDRDDIANMLTGGVTGAYQMLERLAEQVKEEGMEREAKVEVVKVGLGWRQMEVIGT